jgi:hypothetical protein
MLGALILIPALSHFLLQGETRMDQHAAMDEVGIEHVSGRQARGVSQRAALS